MLSSINLHHIKKIYDIVILIKWEMYILPKDPKNLWYQKLEKGCHKPTQSNDQTSLWEFQVLFMSTTWERLEITCEVLYSIKISVTNFFALGTSLINVLSKSELIEDIQTGDGMGELPLTLRRAKIFHYFPV